MNSKNMNNKNMNKNFKKASSRHFHFENKVEHEEIDDPIKQIKEQLSSASEDQILDSIRDANVESWCDIRVHTVDHNSEREIGVTSHSHVSLKDGYFFIAANSGDKKMSIRIPFKVIRSVVHFTFKVMNAYVAFSELLTSLTENFVKEMKSLKSGIKFYKNF